MEGLNGMELGDASLKVARASIGYTQASGLEMGVNAMSMFAGTTSTDLEEGRVLQLLNMITAEELIDNDDYEGVYQPLNTPFPRDTACSLADHYVCLSQKSAKTCKKNAPNTARSSR